MYGAPDDQRAAFLGVPEGPARGIVARWRMALGGRPGGGSIPVDVAWHKAIMGK